MLLVLATACSPTPTDPAAGDPDVVVEDTATGSEPVAVAAPADPFGALELEGEPLRNLLVLSIDTLRRDATGRYGGTEDSPFLDGLLADGVALDRHQACGNWTYPNLVCALSGQLSTELGYVPTTSEGAPDRLPGEIELMANLLSDEGFTTAVVSTNGYFAEDNDMLRGYAHQEQEGAAQGDWVVSRGLDLYQAHLVDAERWALHLHFFDPHSPYDPPEAYLGGLEGLDEIEYDLGRGRIYSDLDHVWPALSTDERKLINEHLDVRYAASVRYLDDQLAALFERLDELGALDDTLVVLWSDHGEQVFDHGRLGHGKSGYQEELAGVAGFWAPGLAPLGWDRPTGHADLLPTAWQLLGLERLDRFTGRVPGAGDLDLPMLSYEYRDAVSFVSGMQDDRKLVYHWSGTWEAYQLADDPGEALDLGEQAEGEWAELHQAVLDQARVLHEDFFPDGAEPVGLE